MKSNIFVPQKIKVGFQERSGTYTGKLAYVIYTDNNGKLRKEISWNSWRSKEIEPEDYENIPIEGFVLNKKVGDYSTGWNHRQAYTRVYDPRGFEFEITIENLLYILENASSIKGKGLEGEFVYGWDGKDLILLPTCSPDYNEISTYSGRIQNNEFIKAKDLKIGITYLTKQNEKWIYMGRFDYWGYDWKNSNREYKNKGKYYFFAYKSNYGDDYYFTTIKSLGQKLIDALSESCCENYAELFDLLEGKDIYSPVDETLDEYVPYTYDEFEKIYKDRRWKYMYFDKKRRELIVNLTDKKYYFDDDRLYGNSRGYAFVDLKEVYNRLNPCYLIQYLKNKKKYREDK